VVEEILYDKLIRDKIPEIIENAGKEYEIHKADEQEYIEKLLLKVEEELAEFKEDPSIAEMADLFEVLDAVIGYYDFDKEQIKDYQEKKRKERGGFKRKLILDKVIENK
jgi:predicted house-cleaning noncanonical NTP pyrophosphatase (MazG superfamily)